MPRRGRSSSSPLLSLPLLIILLPIVAFAFLFFAVRPFLSLTSHSLRPTSVKKSWDSLNIFLVLFAILCGIFARKNDPDESANASSASNKARAEEEEVQSTTQQWFRYSETKIYSSPPVWAPASPATGVTRLKRSSSSYPDLRQESLRETGDDRFQFRFFDDFEIDRYRSLGPRNEPEEPEIKVIPVDTFVLHSSPSQPPPPAKSPPPPPPPPTHPPGVHHESKRTYRRVRRKEDDTKSTKTRPPPPPPPLPPPSPARVRSEQKYGKSERRKSNFKKELAMAWTSLYHQKKRKKKQSKTKNMYDEPVQSWAEPAGNSRPPPSPPPPPPPPSVFHSLFRKGSKSKKVHSVATPPPPPPPPPPVKPSRSSERKIPAPTPAPEPSSRRSSSFSPASRPPLPTRVNSLDEKVILAGARSPVIPIPPPPPSPPFKTREMRFVEYSGFVRVQSAQSSRCGSPEPEEDDPDRESSAGTVNPIDGTDGGGAASVFCPSPDVNIKAATFIARLRDNWKLEKMNSLREKEKMGLGPGP